MGNNDYTHTYYHTQTSRTLTSHQKTIMLICLYTFPYYMFIIRGSMDIDFKSNKTTIICNNTDDE